MVLASLAQETCGFTAPLPSLEALCHSWLDDGPTASSLALYGGLAGLLFGLGCAASRSPGLGSLHSRIRDSVDARISDSAWARPALDWDDYDVVSGPSGLCLVLCADPEVRPATIWLVADHLAALLQSDDMAALRITGCRDDELRGWNFGQINLGLAHGVAGALAALVATLRHTGDREGAPYAQATAKAADWLVAQAHRDTRGLTTWAPARRNTDQPVRPASRREAWCYGAPATAWVLWDAGDVLGRRDLCAFALDTFEVYAAMFDAAFHLDDDPDEHVAMCHGAAGVLMIADSFARHSGSESADELARVQEGLLHDRLPQVEELVQRNPTLLSGGMGVLAALLTRGDADRSWLTALALR